MSTVYEWSLQEPRHHVSSGRPAMRARISLSISIKIDHPPTSNFDQRLKLPSCAVFSYGGVNHAVGFHAKYLMYTVKPLSVEQPLVVKFGRCFPQIPGQFCTLFYTYGGSQRDEYSSGGGATNRSNSSYGWRDNDNDGYGNAYDRRPESGRGW